MVTRSLWGAVLAGAVIAFGSSSAVGAGLALDDRGGTGLYLSFGLAPSLGSVEDFHTGISGAAHVTLPYRKDASGNENISPFDFDWAGYGASGYSVKFKRSSLWGVGGSIGAHCSVGRLEFETVHERFPISKSSGRQWAKGDSVFLLVDDGVAQAIAGRYGGPAVLALQDGRTPSEWHDKFMGLLDAFGVANARGQGTLLSEYDERRKAVGIIAAAYGRMYGNSNRQRDTRSTAALRLLGLAVKASGEEFKSEQQVMMREAVSRVGGYKIEIKGITANTIGANYCYDVTTGIIGSLSPYGCIGAGLSFVEVAGGNSAEFTYQAKLGASYEISPRARVFVGGVYRRIVNYKDRCPVMTLSESSGYSEYTGESNIKATVSFGLHYLAGEAGVRFSL
ncbi:P44/Msp2 family outer membrane protein [Anaplasma capra]|uniref:P44/Msp2 family outer membrane protein n=1 Tax=Anaplasma capra TaxID=1562740 RepID=UPI0021D5AC98|nr:P44/Msp2 family outer membrane protein [Anaplasma capra]MCU7611139.1 P44/Msp2 family outer membrane protein [Anaplasma capra]MCU7612357.1 P44/Msp2 family outer membrane protein [Anaplasma capra]